MVVGVLFALKEIQFVFVLFSSGIHRKEILWILIFELYYQLSFIQEKSCIRRSVLSVVMLGWFGRRLPLGPKHPLVCRHYRKTGPAVRSPFLLFTFSKTKKWLLFLKFFNSMSGDLYIVQGTVCNQPRKYICLTFELLTFVSLWVLSWLDTVMCGGRDMSVCLRLWWCWTVACISTLVK